MLPPIFSHNPRVGLDPPGGRRYMAPPKKPPLPGGLIKTPNGPQQSAKTPPEKNIKGLKPREVPQRTTVNIHKSSKFKRSQPLKNPLLCLKEFKPANRTLIRTTLAPINGENENWIKPLHKSRTYKAKLKRPDNG